VRITETTDYPFDEIVEFRISSSEPVEFPLMLRVPGWCMKPRVSVNGKSIDVVVSHSSWIVLERTWKNGDAIRLELPMEITAKVWAKNHNAVSIHRGPLEYALKIGERWEKFGGSDDWPAFQVFPTTPWNYGLIVSVANAASSFKVVRRGGPQARQPFTPENAPISLSAKGKRIPQWSQEANGLIGLLRDSPVRSNEKEEEVTLIPMGCARLRVSLFPTISEDGNVWK